MTPYTRLFVHVVSVLSVVHRYTSPRFHGAKFGGVANVAIIAASPVHVTTPEGGREGERIA